MEMGSLCHNCRMDLMNSGACNVKTEEEMVKNTVFDSSDSEKTDAWKEFVSVGQGGDGRGRCRCIHCGKVLVKPTMTSNLWRHLRCCRMRPKTISGGNEEQDRPIHDQRYSSIDVVGGSVSESNVVGGSVSESNSEREGVRENTHLKKRQRDSTGSGMLLGLNVLDCPICFETLTIPIFQTLDCIYTGSYYDIYTHFVDNHSHVSKPMSFVCGGVVDVQMNIANEKILVLWESKKRLLFALQCFNEPQGLYEAVRCIAPSAPELGKLAYFLFYSMDRHSLTYKSPEVKRVVELSSETPQDNFMFVPHSLLRGESLEMKIAIGLKV